MPSNSVNQYFITTFLDSLVYSNAQSSKEYELTVTGELKLPFKNKIIFPYSSFKPGI